MMRPSAEDSGLNEFAIKRLRKELEEFQANPPNGFRLIRVPVNLQRWDIEVKGAPGTLYEGETYQLQFDIPESYPIKDPQVIFNPPVPLHPHVYSNGLIRLGVLYEKWSPAQTLESICNSIAEMLSRASVKEKPIGLENLRGSYHPVENTLRQEVGSISSLNFSNRISENWVLHLEIGRTLVAHSDLVNTVSFNDGGDLLLSSSNDRCVKLWDWKLGTVKLSFHSEHGMSVRDAKFMPSSNDGTIVTCDAYGRVRRASILDSGIVETSVLSLHRPLTRKLCIEPNNSNIFYTCGEDGIVQRFDLRTPSSTLLFTCRDHRREIPLNSISIDPTNYNNIAVGGIEDTYARVYDIRRSQVNCFAQFSPPHLIGSLEVGITDLAFSDENELAVSYNDEFIYLYTVDTPSSPVSKSDVPNSKSSSSSPNDDKPSVPLVYKGHTNRFNLMSTVAFRRVNFFGTGSEFVVSGSDCGRIFIWRKKDEKLIAVMESDRLAVNCIASHPHIPVLACSGTRSDIQIWTSTAANRAAVHDNRNMTFRNLIDIDDPVEDEEGYDEEDANDGSEDLDFVMDEALAFENVNDFSDEEAVDGDGDGE